MAECNNYHRFFKVFRKIFPAFGTVNSVTLYGSFDPEIAQQVKKRALELHRFFSFLEQGSDIFRFNEREKEAFTVRASWEQAKEMVMVPDSRAMADMKEAGMEALAGVGTGGGGTETCDSRSTPVRGSLVIDLLLC